MCGIYMTNLPYETTEVEKKIEKIRFRGPDNLSVKKIGDLLLGHLRLAILDLDSRSNQPYSYKGYHISFNGEIYNFGEVKYELENLGYTFDTESDTEVLVKGYAQWGKGVLLRLNGMFAFAIYDELKQEVFCARDRLGVKPFYYFWKDGKFEICSQLKPIHTQTCKVSSEAISIYLDCGYIPSPFTIYEDVYKLQPGSYMLIDLNKKEKYIENYWDLKEVKQTNLSYDEAKERLHQLLIDAVKIRMQSDVPLGTFLSGGIDSALVSAIASRLSKQKINTFTIAFDDPKYDESKVAKQYSQIIESNHTETLCKASDVLERVQDLIKVYDEPFADSSALPSLLLNKITKKKVTVALSGDGGDESFLGYLHFKNIQKFKKISWIPFFIRKVIGKLPIYKVIKSRPETIKGFLSCKDEEDFIKKWFLTNDTQCLKPDYSWIDTYYPQFKKLSSDSIQKAADLNIKLWLENDSNVKVDRASMASSVEIRSPFLDYRIVEFARTLPIDYRLKEGVSKRIIRDILKEYIPQEVFTQPKKGFAVPMGSWLRNELKQDVLSKLNDEFLKTIPNLDIPKFKKKLQQHMDGKYDYSFNIWKLFVLALWTDEYQIKLR